MIRIIVSGCNGTMGQVLSEQISNFDDLSTIAGFDKNIERFNNSYPVYNNLFEINETADIIIDFSNPSTISSLLKYAMLKNIPAVIATTGHSDSQISEIKEASKQIPIFFTANMSLGVNVLKTLAKKAAIILNDTFDIEIIEKHHNKKVDAPSGTAYMIANAINEELDNSKSYVFGREGRSEPRARNEIGIHAVRCGTVVGEHTIIFAGLDEVVEIKHSATSKKIFTSGAINASRFLIDKAPGLYTMDDLLK